LLSPCHRLDVVLTAFEEKLGSNRDICIVEAANFYESRAGHALGLRIEMTAAV